MDVIRQVYVILGKAPLVHVNPHLVRGVATFWAEFIQVLSTNFCWVAT